VRVPPGRFGFHRAEPLPEAASATAATTVSGQRRRTSKGRVGARATATWSAQAASVPVMIAGALRASRQATNAPSTATGRQSVSHGRGLIRT